MVELHHQPRHLPQRREAAPGDHRRGDDAAHGHLLLLDFIDADDDDGNRYQLLHGRDEADGEGRGELELGADVRDVFGGVFPLALHAALGIECLDGFQVGE